MDYKILSFFFCILFYGSLCKAQLRDPTKPAYFSPLAAINEKKTEDLKLSSISISKQSKRVTINGIIAKQGDVILSGIKIIKIYNNSVLIKQNGRTKKLTIFNHSFKTSPSK